MNIVRTLINKKALTAGAFLLGTLGAVRYTLTPAQIDVICDQRFAVDVRTSIKKIIEKSAVRSLGAHGLLALLEKEYPFVQSVAIEYKSSLRARVMVGACIPLVCVSSSLPGTKEYILCKSRTDSSSALQIDKSLWSPEAIGGLPLIIIEGPEFDQTRLLPEFVESAFEMKSTIFDQYSVTWRSKTEIVLQSLTESIILMADSATVHDEERLNYVQSIYKADKESYKDGMKADIRLRDSVICAPLVRK